MVMDLAQTFAYLYFLTVILVIVYFSARLAINNSFEKDTLDFAKLYQEQKRSEVSFYLTLFKRKMWILGVFGVYLGVFVFLAILNQVFSNLALTDLQTFFESFIVVLGWGFIPFIIFWMIYIIIFFYKSFESTIKYQFGEIGGKK